MSKKRPSLKGKGADIFLSKEEEVFTTQKDAIPPETQSAITPSKQKTMKTDKIKVTFYLPSILLDGLDEIWLRLKRGNRKLKKSDLVTEALKKFLEEDFKKIFEEYKENQ